MFDIGYGDLVKIIKALGHDDFTAEVVADYLDELDYDIDLSYYLWNTLLFNVEVFKTKDEALQYIEDNLCCEVEDCTIHECSGGVTGVYLEY